MSFPPRKPSRAGRLRGRRHRRSQLTATRQPGAQADHIRGLRTYTSASRSTDRASPFEQLYPSHYLYIALLPSHLGLTPCILRLKVGECGSSRSLIFRALYPCKVHTHNMGINSDPTTIWHLALTGGRLASVQIERTASNSFTEIPMLQNTKKSRGSFSAKLPTC